MPHKPAPKDGAMPIFVSSSLTVELKPQLARYAEKNEDDIGKLIAGVLFEGYSFAAKAENDTGFQASLRATESCKRPGNKGKMLVERAGSPERAILRLFWAHHELFEGSWPKGERAIDDDW